MWIIRKYIHRHCIFQNLIVRVNLFLIFCLLFSSWLNQIPRVLILSERKSLICGAIELCLGKKKHKI